MKIDLQAARPQGKLRALRPGDKFNLTDLNVRPAELPQLDDPVKPSVESMNRMLGKYYIMAGVDTGSVLAEMRNVNDTKTELEKA
jgi:hypothetical protein